MNKNSRVVYLGNPAIPNPSNLFKIPTPQLRTESFHRQRNRKFNRKDSIFAETTTYARPQPMIEKMLKPKEDKSIDLGFLKTSNARRNTSNSREKKTIRICESSAGPKIGSCNVIDHRICKTPTAKKKTSRQIFSTQRPKTTNSQLGIDCKISKSEKTQKDKIFFRYSKKMAKTHFKNKQKFDFFNFISNGRRVKRSASRPKTPEDLLLSRLRKHKK